MKNVEKENYPYLAENVGTSFVSTIILCFIPVLVCLAAGTEWLERLPAIIADCEGVGR